MTSIAHSKPWITAEDEKAIATLLSTSMIAQGETTRAFESGLAGRFGLEGSSAVAVASGGAAVALALLGLGVGRGDEVVLPSYVCPSVLEAVRTAGAEPVLCDVGPHWVVTPEEVAPRMTARTRALVVPHLYGIFADVGALRRFGVPIVEDCAQALGARGTRRLEGDIATFSFHPTKCLTTGEGGMAITPGAALATRLRELRDGRPLGDQERLFAPLSDLAAALGLSQLARYEAGLARRRELALRYRERLAPRLLTGFPWEGTMFLRLPLRVPGGVDAFGPAFLERGVHVRRGVDKLLHRFLGRPDAEFPRSTEHFLVTLSLPLYPALTDAEHERCLRAAEAILPRA